MSNEIFKLHALSERNAVWNWICHIYLVSAEKCCSQRSSGNLADLQAHKVSQTCVTIKSQNTPKKVPSGHLCVSSFHISFISLQAELTIAPVLFVNFLFSQKNFHLFSNPWWNKTILKFVINMRWTCSYRTPCFLSSLEETGQVLFIPLGPFDVRNLKRCQGTVSTAFYTP